MLKALVNKDSYTINEAMRSELRTVTLLADIIHLDMNIGKKEFLKRATQALSLYTQIPDPAQSARDFYDKVQRTKTTLR